MTTKKKQIKPKAAPVKEPKKRGPKPGTVYKKRASKASQVPAATPKEPLHEVALPEDGLPPVDLGQLGLSIANHQLQAYTDVASALADIANVLAARDGKTGEYLLPTLVVALLEAVGSFYLAKSEPQDTSAYDALFAKHNELVAQHNQLVASYTALYNEMAARK